MPLHLETNATRDRKVNSSIHNVSSRRNKRIMTRIQLETGFIDLPIGTDFPIDLSFAEITKSGARTGGASRSLEVDGTENNTTILGALIRY
jgi:hypothetical protein